MGWLFDILPSGAAIWAALAGAIAAGGAWIARSARIRAEASAKEKDHEHAEAVEDRVSRDRADPDRLRPFDDAGFRD